MQRGYLPSRDILLNSIFGEANANNAGATLVWDWIAWPSDDSGYSFDVWTDGSNAMHAQIGYMNSKVCSLLALPKGHALDSRQAAVGAHLHMSGIPAQGISVPCLSGRPSAANNGCMSCIHSSSPNCMKCESLAMLSRRGEVP